MATPYEGYLGILDQGRASSSEFAFKQAQFDKMQKDAANLELERERVEAERQRVNVDRDRQLDISKQQADTSAYQTRTINQGNLEVNQAEQLNRDAAERRAANKQKKAELSENINNFTFDSMSRLNQMAKNATGEGNFEKAQMYNKMAKDLSTRSTKGEDFDYINMISTVYGPENIGQVLNDLGVGTSLLEDWKNPETKGFANFAFNPETGKATTAVQTERGLHPVTAGGQNFSDGGETIEGGEFDISQLNKLINLHEAQFGSPEADLIAQTSGGERNKNLTLKGLFKEGRLDLLEMDRAEKEDLALSPNSTFEAMSENIARDLYGELMVEPEIEPVDATFKITPSGIQADSGIDLSGENAAAVIKDSFGGRFKRQGPASTSSASASFIVKNNPATYQNYVHDAKAPFGLTLEDKKDLTQNQIKLFEKQSSLIAKASALIALDEVVYSGEPEGLAGAPLSAFAAASVRAIVSDIGKMMAGLDSGTYKENTFINGERYSKAQAEEVKKFYEGNRDALGFKLATDVKYRQEFIDMGPMKFALNYAEDPELFKRAGITKKIQTKAKVDLAQMKTYLKKNHDITIPTGADLTPESLEEFNNKVNNLEGLSQELKNEWDTKLAAILNLSIDRNTDTIDTTWLGTDNYNNYMAAMALSVTPDVDDNMRQHFFNLATYGKSTGILAQDATEIDNFTQLATSRAALQVSAGAKQKNDKVTFDKQIDKMSNLAETTLGYLLGEQEYAPGRPFSTRPIQPDAVKYEIALQEMFEIRKDVLNYHGPRSSQYQRISERLYSTVSAQAEKFVEDNESEGWFGFWYGPNASLRASDAIADVRMTIFDDNAGKMVALTKMSQLWNEESGDLDVSKLKGMSVVQGKLDIGRGGSFYKFVQQEGMESGLVILDMMGLENDIETG